MNRKEELMSLKKRLIAMSKDYPYTTMVEMITVAMAQEEKFDSAENTFCRALRDAVDNYLDVI